MTFSVTGHKRQNTITNPETLEEELNFFNSVPKYSLPSISINLGRCPSKLQMSTIVPVFINATTDPDPYLDRQTSTVYLKGLCVGE